MKGKNLMIMAIAACYPLGCAAQGIRAVADSLTHITDFNATASFEVLLPSSADPVKYTVDMVSQYTPADTLAPCSYLIRWAMPTDDGTSAGFSAYFDGHHYRYHGDRLQEYHIEWDKTPFMPGGRKADGVQSTARFADLLPQMVGRQLEQMCADTTFRYTFTPDTIYDGIQASVLKGIQTVRGLDGMEYTYVFDRDSGAPLSIDLDYNPGSISEQSVSVRYSYPSSKQAPVLSEQALMEMYPAIFEKYRDCNFHIENLPGTPLPTFSAPTATGERYTRHRNDPMHAPTILALLDPDAGSPKIVVEDIRKAIASLPFPADIIWAFVSTNTDEIEAITGPQAQPGEYTLIGARALARDTGATSLPVMILTDNSGTVTDVILGVNNNLTSDIIQKMAIAN
ncbi:MAG: hypothetical protein K2O12_00075 [Muribaculaceae bacterium]|nr:hypothetical protein [Muribaculaceae bacterium]